MRQADKAGQADTTEVSQQTPTWKRPSGMKKPIMHVMLD